MISSVFQVTGHSLGGSVASIAATWILNQYQMDQDRIKLITFGQPRTGDTDYALAHNMKVKIDEKKDANFENSMQFVISPKRLKPIFPATPQLSRHPQTRHGATRSAREIRKLLPPRIGNLVPGRNERRRQVCR